MMNEKKKTKTTNYGHDDGIFFIWCLICKIYISEYQCMTADTADFSDKNGCTNICTLYFWCGACTNSRVFTCVLHKHTLLSISTINVEWGTHHDTVHEYHQAHTLMLSHMFYYMCILVQLLVLYPFCCFLHKIPLLCFVHQLPLVFFFGGQSCNPVENLYFCVFGHGVFRCATIVRGRSFAFCILCYMLYYQKWV